MAWSNAKTAVVVGLGICLAAGGTVTVVKSVMPVQVDEAFWQMKGENLDKAPPVLILRPAKFLDNTAMTRGEEIPKVVDKGPPMRIEQVLEVDRAIVHHDMLAGLIEIAYSMRSQRTILPAEVPPERYDLMMTLRDHPREALQAAMRKQLGYDAHTEMVTTNVLLLHVSNAALLAEHAGKPDEQIQYSQTNHAWVFGNYPINATAEYFERCLNIPVELAPGLTGGYSGSITVPGSDPRRVITRGALKTVTTELNKMGLDLMATNMPIEMLVVEKVK
jgi:uncharacterized protein (TIGR03435 family)